MDTLNALLANVQVWGALLGIVTPLATALVQQPGWSRKRRQVVGVACSVLVGVATVGAAGELGDTSTVLTTLPLVAAAAQVAYTRLWQPKGVAPVIERASSPRTL